MKHRTKISTLIKSFSYLFSAAFSAWVLAYSFLIVFFYIKHISKSVVLANMPSPIADFFPELENKIKVELTISIVFILIFLPFMIKSILQFFDHALFLFTDVVVNGTARKKLSPVIAENESILPDNPDEKEISAPKIVENKKEELKPAKVEKNNVKKQPIMVKEESSKVPEEHPHPDKAKPSRKIDIESNEIHNKLTNEAIAQSFIEYEKAEDKPIIKEEPVPQLDVNRDIKAEMPKSKPLRKPADKEEDFLQNLNLFSLMGFSKAKSKKPPKKINRKMDIA